MPHGLLRDTVLMKNDCKTKQIAVLKTVYIVIKWGERTDVRVTWI